VTSTLGGPTTRITIGARPSINGSTFPGEMICSATRPDGMSVEIGVAASGSLRERAARAKAAGFSNDDGAEIAHLGDAAITSYLNGVSVRHGTALVRVAVFPGGKARAEIIAAEGVPIVDTEASVIVARALLTRLDKLLSAA